MKLNISSEWIQRMAKKEAECDVMGAAFVPSLVLTGTSGNVRVVSKLYGDVTPERAAREAAVVKRRAEQLDPSKPERVTRQRVMPDVETEDE